MLEFQPISWVLIWIPVSIDQFSLLFWGLVIDFSILKKYLNREWLARLGLGCARKGGIMLSMLCSNDIAWIYAPGLPGVGGKCGDLKPISILWSYRYQHWYNFILSWILSRVTMITLTKGGHPIATHELLIKLSSQNSQSIIHLTSIEY